MDEFSYDITQLSKFSDMDAAKAEKNFPSQQEFFSQLTHFVNIATGCLHSYTPAVVIFSDENRSEFWDEFEKTNDLISALEMSLAISELENIKNAVNDGNVTALSDGFVKFNAKMNILKSLILSARLPEEKTSSSSKSKKLENAEKSMVMAVDDSRTMLSTVAKMLKHDYNIITLNNGNDALNLLDHISPELFLLDIEMPDMSGHELASNIRALRGFENTPILFLSSHSDRENVLQAKGSGINDYILKPPDKQLLLKKIERHLNIARG